jgi:hypothetical protein
MAEKEAIFTIYPKTEIYGKDGQNIGEISLSSGYDL